MLNFGSKQFLNTSKINFKQLNNQLKMKKTILSLVMVVALMAGTSNVMAQDSSKKESGKATTEQKECCKKDADKKKCDKKTTDKKECSKKDGEKKAACSKEKK